MVDTRGERLLGLLVKFGRAALTSEDSTETTETYKEQETIVDPEAEPTMLYWEKDKQEYTNQNQAYIDLYQKGVALEKIPNSVEGKYPESRYKFDNILSYLPDHLANNIDTGIPETPKTGTGISSSGRDAGVVAGIVVAVISGVIILTALIAVLMYRHYVHRNVTSMNFDNPVYRKTTEDQFALEKNGYAPGSKLYPSTVGEEAQEPLNTPGTNDFV